MLDRFRLSVGAGAAFLLPLTALSGCNQAPQPSATNIGGVAAGAAEAVTNAIDFNANDVVVEDEASAPDVPVTVPAVPTVAPGTSPEDAQPIRDAATLEAEIKRGTGITRVRHGDGWAWIQGGHILRTASRDGREVAYFRPLEDKPYFVQHDQEAFAYKGDRVTRAYDRAGRPHTPDAQRTREAEQAARRVHDERQHAHEAVRNPDRDERGGKGRSKARPAPTPAATSDGRHPDRGDGNTQSPDRGQDGPDRH